MKRNGKTQVARRHIGTVRSSVEIKPKRHQPRLPPDEAQIRELAYSLWQSAGSPVGDGIAFWLKAEQMLLKPRTQERSA